MNRLYDILAPRRVALAKLSHIAKTGNRNARKVAKRDRLVLVMLCIREHEARSSVMSESEINKVIQLATGGTSKAGIHERSGNKRNASPCNHGGNAWHTIELYNKKRKAA